MKEKLRLAILDAYGIDIDKYEFEYKRSLNAYTININEFTIRITAGDDVPKDLRLARLQWALDLKHFKNTICEPIPSKHGELIEDVHVGKWHLTISMFRTARGQLMKPENIKPMFFISAGDMLGTMHRMSIDRDSSEEAYGIPDTSQVYEAKYKRIRPHLSPDLNMRIVELVNEIATREKNIDNFGICYGEFDLHNIIVDTNNIHLFDFDGTIFAHYLYDIASFGVSLLSSGYMPGVKAKDVFFKHFLPWFKIGYGISMPCTDKTFEDIELFMGLRGVWLLLSLVEKYQTEELPEIKQQIDFISAILLSKNIFWGIDIARNALFPKK